MVETVPTLFGSCACDQTLPSAGAKRCPRCRAAHARKHIGRRASVLRRLPFRATAFREAEWLACNVGLKRVNLSSAPSRTAVNLLAALNKDEKLRRAFWTTHWKMRLKRPYD